MNAKKRTHDNCSWSSLVKTCCFNRVLVSEISMAPIQWLFRDVKKARRDVLSVLNSLLENCPGMKELFADLLLIVVKSVIEVKICFFCEGFC